MLTSKKQVLYLGLNPAHYHHNFPLVHFPVIEIVPRPKTDPQIVKVFRHIRDFSHIIFTSKNGVHLFFDALTYYDCKKMVLGGAVLIAVGHATALVLEKMGISADFVAGNECQEGIVEILSELDLEGAHILLPGSSIARPLLSQYLSRCAVEHCPCPLYDTVTRKVVNLPNLDEVGEIIFTSPSTVKAFFEIFDGIPMPADIRLTALGPVTQEVLKERLALDDMQHCLHSDVK